MDLQGFKDSRPVIRITGSHRHFCMFGAVGLDNRQIFREYNRFNQNTFYEFLKQLHYKFPRCYLFLDKASLTPLQIRESEEVL
jgi:hypothetical protein